MRLSDFISSGSKSPSSAEPSSPKKNPAPEVKPKEPAKPARESILKNLPPLNPEVTEAKIREKVQSEFEREIARVREEVQRQFQTQLDSEKKRLELKEKEIEKSQAQVQSQIEKMEKEKLAAEKLKLESDWRASLEEEKKKMKAALEIELSKARAMIQDLEKKAAEPNQAKPEVPQTKSELAAKVEEAPQVVPPAESHLLQPTYLTKETPGASAPIAEIDLSALMLEVDPEQLDHCRKIRDDLITDTTMLFDYAAKGIPFKIENSRALLAAALVHVLKKDFELIQVVLEPYPEGNHFICHGVNVALIALVLAQEFSLSEAAVLDLGEAALLHDVGLVSVREDLNYPKKLTAHLEKEILNHPERGAEILKPYLSEEAILGVIQHHEVANGKGYPKGLSGEEIHLYARIIHIADSFEALVHERPYRKEPLEVHEAVKQLIDAGRGVYDRDSLKALMVRIGLYPVMTEVELSNKQIGKVVRQNRQFPLSPVIRVEREDPGGILAKPFLIDLSRTQFVHIVGPVRRSVAAAHTTSRFAAAQEEPKVAVRNREIMDFIQGAISITLVIVLFVVMLLIVVKI